VFIGGGNTFRLLKALYDHDLLGVIRERVSRGMPYIGSSAGSNIAAPTIRTTNDMPIVQPPSFDALGLVSFQINPHYLDPDPNSTHKGETREERIIQFLEENETPVVGIREGAMLRIENGKTQLRGSTGARIFRRGHEPVETVPGDYLDELVS
jgi:dipeptidase E